MLPKNGRSRLHDASQIKGLKSGLSRARFNPSSSSHLSSLQCMVFSTRRCWTSGYGTHGYLQWHNNGPPKAAVYTSATFSTEYLTARVLELAGTSSIMSSLLNALTHLVLKAIPTYDTRVAVQGRDELDTFISATIADDSIRPFIHSSPTSSKVMKPELLPRNLDLSLKSSSKVS